MLLGMLPMKIDQKKLGEFIKNFIRPLWEEQDPDNLYRDGGGEAYLHDKVLAKAHPLMNIESITKDPKGSLHGALKAHDNLLSQFGRRQKSHHEVRPSVLHQ